MSTPTRTDEDMARATRRATVKRMTNEGMSRRAIGTKLGISKETVRRDLEYLARAEAHHGADGARHQPPAHVPPAHHGADGARHEPPARVPPLSHPDPVAQLAADSPQFASDLAALTDCGRSASSAIVHAVHVLAGIYRKGWLSGLVPLGTEPEIDEYRLRVPSAPVPIRKTDPGPPPLRLRPQPSPDEAA